MFGINIYFCKKYSFNIMKKSFLVVALLFSIVLFGQYRYRDGNRIGISGGVNLTSLNTSDFKTKPEMGWAAGLSVRGNYYNNWSMTFGMQFFQNKFSVATTSLLKNEAVVYKSMGAQVRLVLSYNIIKNHLALDFGPVLQVNDKLKINADDENNLISGKPLLMAKDIVDVSKVNGNFYAGISAGSKLVKVVVSYQYGLNNFLNKLNNDDVLRLKNNNDDFKGHLGIISGQLLINL